MIINKGGMTTTAAWWHRPWQNEIDKWSKPCFHANGILWELYPVWGMFACLSVCQYLTSFTRLGSLGSPWYYNGYSIGLLCRRNIFKSAVIWVTGYELFFNEPLWWQLWSLEMRHRHMITPQKSFLKFIWCLSEPNPRHVYSGNLVWIFRHTPCMDFTAASLDGAACPAQ